MTNEAKSRIDEFEMYKKQKEVIEKTKTSEEDKAKYLFENCWYWVKPDEANYIESMVDSLQIIISVPDMKRITQERLFAIQRNEAAIAECKENVALQKDQRDKYGHGVMGAGTYNASIRAYQRILEILEG